MTPSPAEPLWETDPTMWPVVLATVIATVLCVGLHGEVVCRLSAWGKASTRSARIILPACVLTLLATHIVQVHIFAAAHFFIEWPFGDRVGVLSMKSDGSFTERIYFSAVVFSTLGFGDIVPVGPIRLMVAAESITGLMLIAWSASMTYGVLEREHVARSDRIGRSESKATKQRRAKS